MNKHPVKDISLIASIASCFTQIGAQLFAILVIIANWRTTRRNLLLLSLALFLAGSAVAALVVQPGFGKLLANGYSNVVDATLQGHAATLYTYEWGLWCIALAAGMTLLVALARPVAVR